MTFTRSTYTALVNASRNGWATLGSTARLASDPRAGLAAWLMTAQAGTCALCGETAEQPELCHIAPGGRERLGWTAGNIVIGCRTCNEIDGDNLIPFESIMRPDLVQTEWPERTFLRDLGITEKVNREEARDRKRRIRGM